MKYIAYLAAACAALSATAPAAAQTNEQPVTLRANVCNKHNENIYVATGAPVEAVGEGGFDVRVYGWYLLEPRECKDLNIGQYDNAEIARKVAVFLYAETEGLFGGAIKKVWEGKGWDACLLTWRAQQEFHSFKWELDGGRVRKNPCNAPGEFKAGMIRVNPRKSDGAVRYDFTSQ